MAWVPKANIKGPAGEAADSSRLLPDPTSQPVGMVPITLGDGGVAWFPVGVLTVDDIGDIPSTYVGLVAVRQP